MADTSTIEVPKVKKVTLFEEQVIENSKEHQLLLQEFDANKKYMFELAAPNMVREIPPYEITGTGATARAIPMVHLKFKPYQNIVLTSQIVWNGQRRMLRYYDGCTSIFADKQPRDKDTIDQLIKQTNRAKYKFLEGKFGCYGDEKQLLLYLNACSWNGESEFRTRTADIIFISSNKDKTVTLESNKLDKQEEALKLAKEATTTKMYIHANYLGISATDWDSGNELSEKEIRIEYRKSALQDSVNFIESYGNKVIELKYYIDKALLSGIINNKMNANRAVWAKSNSEICDISGLRSNEAIADKLLEYSQTEEGQEFGIQLKALYN